MPHWQGNQGESSENQQYFYDDGRTQVSYSSSTWTSPQPGTTMQMPPMPQLQRQLPLLGTPQMIQAPDLGQMHQMHMNMHQATINTMPQNFGNMIPMYQPQLPALMPTPPPLQAQIEYFEHDQPQSLIEQFQSNASQNQFEHSQPPAMQSRTRELAIPQSVIDARDEERRQEIIRETSKLNNRLERMEQSQAQNKEQQEAKEREIAASRTREQQLQQQMFELEQRHSQQIADMAKAQATTPQPAPAFDMSALQKMIGDAQQDKISKADIKQLIEESVKQQMSGVAKASDIESAASRVERGLNRAPKGVSADQLQQTIQNELANALKQVARHVTPQKTIEQPPTQEYPWQSISAPQVQHAYASVPVPKIQSTSKSRQSAASSAPQAERSANKPKQSTVSFASQDTPPTTSLSPAALARLPTDSGGRSSLSKSIHSKSRASVMPTLENTMVHAKQPDGKLSNAPKMSTAPVPPAPVNTLALPKLREGTSSLAPKMSTLSVQPSISNAIARPSTTESAGHRESSPREHKENYSSKKSTMSVQPSPDNALVRPGHAENSSRENKEHKSSRKSTTSVQPSADNAPVRPSHDESSNIKHKEYKSSKKSTMSVQPSADNTLVRPGHDESSHREQKESKSSKKSTMSVQPSLSNALVRPGHSSSQPAASSANAASAARSQIGQTGMQSTADQGTVARIQPKNDRRDDDVASIQGSVKERRDKTRK